MRLTKKKKYKQVFPRYHQLAVVTELLEDVKKNGVVLSSTFMRLGVLVSMVLSIAVFGERPEFLQVIGFVIAIGAILLIQTDKEKTTVSFKAGLFILLLLNGSADAMSKIYDEVGNPACEEYFLLFTFIFALLLCAGLVWKRGEKVGRAEVVYGMLIGIPNYFSARFLLLALGELQDFCSNNWHPSLQ